MSIRNRYFGALTAAAAFGFVPMIHAAPLTFSASQGNLAASVTFENDGGSLKVTLTNTSLSDVLVPADILTAVFWSFSGGTPSLTTSSAILGMGSTVLFGGSDPGGVVGGEWAYGTGLVGAPGSANTGISSSGLGLFGNANFPGTNLQGPVGVDGLQYGIASAGDNPALGNSAVTGSNSLIKNQVVFMLSGLGLDFDPSARINTVSFQYGTALNEPNIPEPATLAMSAIAGFLIQARSQRQRRPQPFIR